MAKRITALFLISFCLLSVNALLAQSESAKIQWLSWEEALEKVEIEPRKIVLDVYTEWCVWCKKMDEQTFENESIIKYINENYYAVKFDAEQRDEIEYNGKVYKFVKSGRNGYHELAAELLKGRLTFPTLVFMEEDMEIIQSLAGYKSPMQFMQMITYFGENRHRNTPWSTYKKSFAPPQMFIKNDDH
jgi:thioredoxin-related protein